jgi:hypothetical protein
VHDDIDRGRHLIADVGGGEIDTRHHRHRLETPEQVAARVGVRGGERAVVTRVHRLEHVQRLATANLADDDPVGPHPERVADQIPNRHLPAPFDVGGAGLQRDHMRSVEAELCGVLDRDQALVVRDERREDPEQGRLAAAGPTAHDDVGTPANARGEEPHRARPDRALLEDVLGGQRHRRERADREHGAAERKGRNDRVHPAAPRKSRVHPR